MFQALLGENHQHVRIHPPYILYWKHQRQITNIHARDGTSVDIHSLQADACATSSSDQTAGAREGLGTNDVRKRASTHPPQTALCALCACAEGLVKSKSSRRGFVHHWHGYGHSRITFSKTRKRCSESKDQITRETSAAPGGSFENGMQNIFSCWKFILLHDDQQHWSKPLPMHRKGLINVYTIARILGWNPKQGVRMQLLCVQCWQPPLQVDVASCSPVPSCCDDKSMESAIESTAKNVGLAALKPKQHVCYWEQCLYRLDMELRSTTAVLKRTQA